MSVESISAFCAFSCCIDPGEQRDRKGHLLVWSPRPRLPFSCAHHGPPRWRIINHEIIIRGLLRSTRSRGRAALRYLSSD